MVTAGRLHFTRAQLATLGTRRASWPVVSLGLLCVLGVVFPPGLITAMNLYLLAFAALVLLASRRAVPALLTGVLWPFGAIIVVGLLGASGAQRYLILKDAWYGSNPAVLLCVGWVLGQATGDLPRALRAFVIGGTLVATLHMLRFALNPELLSLQATQIRGFAGTGYHAAGLATVLLLACWGRWRERLALPPQIALVLFVPCAASVVLSFSRTMTMVVVIALLALAGVFARREWLRIGVLVAGVVLVLGVLHTTVDTDTVQAKRSFVGKLARSLDELQSQDRMSLRDINENWRGFETQRAVDTWQQGGAFELAFGRGFGFQVDLGIFQNLSGARGAAVRYIPIFHNGYVYLLVKTGIAGVLLYALVLARLYRLGRQGAGAAVADEARFAARLLQACALILALTTWVVAGAFNKFDLLPFMLLTGVLLRRLSHDGVTA